MTDTESPRSKHLTNQHCCSAMTLTTSVLSLTVPAQGLSPVVCYAQWSIPCVPDTMSQAWMGCFVRIEIKCYPLPSPPSPPLPFPSPPTLALSYPLPPPPLPSSAGVYTCEVYSGRYLIGWTKTITLERAGT